MLVTTVKTYHGHGGPRSAPASDVRYEAVQRALTSPANPGFLHPDADADAVLGVISLADEDDRSLEHASLLGPDGPELGTRGSFRCTRFGVLCDQGLEPLANPRSSLSTLLALKAVR